MSTKDKIFTSKGNQQSFVKSRSDNDSHRYSNFNLNQNHKCYNENSSVHFKSKSNKSQNFDSIVTEKRSWNKISFNDQSSNKFKLFNSKTESEIKKRWNDTSKTISTSKNNGSTLSLHIAAYENSIDTVLSSVDRDSFEFPRQQEDGETGIPEPEVMQFKANQKLLKPSQSSESSNDQKVNEREEGEENEEERMMCGADAPGQNGGGIRRFWNKMGGNVEQTKMAPDFVKNIENFDSYKETVDLLVDRLEIAVQQNPNILATGVIECLANENPHEKTAASLAVFSTYFGGNQNNSVKELIDENKKLAQIERASQVQARKAIRHLRRFYIEEYRVATDERNKLNKAREHMDLMKHEVKQAKTTEQIEKKAILYEEAVGAFDTQASKVIECLSQLPSIQQTHVKDIVEYFDTIGQFHTKMAAAITKRDLQQF